MIIAAITLAIGIVLILSAIDMWHAIGDKPVGEMWGKGLLMLTKMFLGSFCITLNVVLAIDYVLMEHLQVIVDVAKAGRTMGIPL